MKTHIYSHDEVPSLTVRHLASATLRENIITVPKEVKLQVAVTQMLMHDFSQLPVVNGTRSILGAVTWKGIARLLAQGKTDSSVKDCITDAPTVSIDASLFDALDELNKNEFLLVLDQARKLTGIITHTDITEEFSKLGEPFLLLGEIEKSLRKLIAPVFPQAKQLIYSHKMNSIEINSPADLTLGNFLQVLSATSLWDALQMDLLDRECFIAEMSGIMELRNRLMHFREPFLERSLVERIRRFKGFLDYLLQNRVRSEENASTLSAESPKKPGNVARMNAH